VCSPRNWYEQKSTIGYGAVQGKEKKLSHKWILLNTFGLEFHFFCFFQEYFIK
jgi:hypothetical protein